MGIAVITEFGAAGDGKTLCTDAIQRAVDSQPEGGTVVVPAGTFLTGTIQLRSNTVLYLEPGAILRGAPDMEAYWANGFRQKEMGENISLLYALDAENIAVRGRGTIDCSGRSFMDLDTLVPPGVPPDRLSTEQVEECVVMFKARPNQPIFFHNCARIAVEDICIRDAPCWTLTFSCCRDVRVTGIVVDNHPRFPNNDGIHLSASRDVLISNCRLSCGDDCIAMTCITDWDGMTENVIVSDCILSSRSAAVRMGHLASRVEQVLVRGCIIHNTNRGFAVFAGDGGHVRHVSVADIQLQTRVYAGGWWGKGEPAVICAAESKGEIAGISFSRIRGRCENPFLIAGTDGNVSDVSLADIQLKISQGRNHALYADSFDMEPNCRPGRMPGRGGWIYSSGVTGLNLDRIRAELV